jgi:hypothetical protein
MQLRWHLALLASIVTATACRPDPATPATAPASAAGGGPAPSFELDCDSSETATAAELFCVRTDTRTGDILRVHYRNLPISQGSTAVSGTVPGRFTTICAATSTDTESEFFCIRLNTESGEMLLVNLQKIGGIPEPGPE